MAMNKAMPTSPYGVWTVTTEGDCEGRSVHNLGTHEGYIDDIAFALADKCYYALRFSQTPLLDQKMPKRTRVNVSLDIDSGTWDMKPLQRVAMWENLMKSAGRAVTILPGQSYASVELVSGSDPVAIAEREKELKREQARAKLTDEERELLGIK